MSDLRMELIHGQLNDIEENVRSIKATWGNTIMTIDNIKSSLKADRQKAIEEAYQKGYDEAWESVGESEDRVARQAYQKGLDDAWECARKIVVEKGSGGYTYEHLEEALGTRNIHKILCNMTPSEVIAKLKAYEQQKPDEIEVGD